MSNADIRFGQGLNLPLDSSEAARWRDGHEPAAARRPISYTLIKRVADMSIAAFVLIVSSPLLLLLVLIVRASSRGPALFFQERVGQGGRRFTMIKLRTMVTTARAYATSPGCDTTDPRITPIGRFLRRTKLDELPQCINVLRGEMSIVGPRPEMPFIVDQYGESERFRLRVKPGITGLWQISPERYQPIHENLHYDRYYITHRSLRLDLAIMLNTLMLMLQSFTGRGGSAHEAVGDEPEGESTSVAAGQVREAQA